MEGESSHHERGRGLAPSASSTAVHTPQRPSTPNESLSRNPFTDGVESQASNRSGHNPFASPEVSRPASSYESSQLGNRFDDRGYPYFHSRRVRKDEVEKPWTKNKDPKEKWVTILPLIGIGVGLAISAFLIYDGMSSVVKHNYCMVMDEDFSNGLDTSIWTQEVQLGGFGNGEFEMTTAGTDNVFIENGNLVIKATIQDDSLMKTDNVINLLADGSCTSTVYTDCVAATNTTAGNVSVVPPALSGRINTKKGATIKYGRVEVTAKMPVGDWLWPAIWMLPVNDSYGAWPESGEIDIAESRGNNHTYAQGGNNIVSSTLHWGPNPANDAYWRNNNKRQALHTTYAAGFNTFGVEWSQKYLYTYVNSRLLQVLYTNFDESLWARGSFPAIDSNGTLLKDPWTAGGLNAPFDQEFYLILNLAVGGTNGWFEDGQSGKPWYDSSDSAKKDFYNASSVWLPTWTQPQLEVSRVVMMQQCDGNEDL